MVTVGQAFTLAPVVALRPVAGLHVYVEPPAAVKVAQFPEQMVALFTVIAGSGLTVTTAVAVRVQPAALVPVTVYDVVTVGHAFTVAPVVALKPVAGVHV